MGVLEPLALLAAVIAGPIILLYMLRLRRQEITISSSMLWRQVLQDRQANAPWQKLRRNLLLYLQLLILAALVLALARPFVQGTRDTAGNMVIILDGSASMQATDGADSGNGQTRFARAQAEAGTLVDGLTPGSRMTLILAGPVPVTLISASSDRAALRATLAAARPTAAPADLTAAVTLAAAAANAPDTTLAVISDGAIPAGRLPDVNAVVRYIPVGHRGDNAAITALALRDAPQGPQLFVGLANSGDKPVSGLLNVEVDGRLWDSRSVQLDATGTSEQTLPDLPLDTRLVTATLKIDDPLALDNTAWAARGRGANAATLLVSAGNSFLEKALALLPQVRLARSETGTYKPGPGYDLTIFDSYIPATLPPGNLLLINPSNSPLVPVSGTLAYPALGPPEGDDPLLRYVNFNGVHVAEAAHIQTPSWARTLVRTAGGDPLLLAGETEGRRVVVIAFDLHKSDLALQVSFPILMANLVGWLAPGSALDLPPRLLPGSALAIHPLPEADRVLVDIPAGPSSAARTVSLPTSANLSFSDTGTPGLYRIRQTAKDKPVGDAEWFAVNLLDSAESAIAPRPTLDLQGKPVTGTAASGPREVAPLLLALALLLLGLEWWLYHHGQAGLLRGLRLARRKA